MTLAHKRAIARGIRKAKRARKKYYRRSLPTVEMSKKDKQMMVCSQALTILQRIIDVTLD